jgi:thiol-disulfide isomerase/thioredoxin
VTAREVLDGIKARTASTHPECADCGKCRVTLDEDWCPKCEYFSCEREPDCADPAPSTVARLTGALEAGLETLDDLMQNYDANVRYTDLEQIRAAIENALVTE